MSPGLTASSRALFFTYGSLCSGKDNIMLRKQFQPRDQFLIVRLTPAEKESVQRAATSRGLTASEYIRRLAETPPDTTIRDMTKQLAECRYLTLDVRDNISSALVESSSPIISQDLNAALNTVKNIGERLSNTISELKESQSKGEPPCHLS